MPIKFEDMPSRKYPFPLIVRLLGGHNPERVDVCPFYNDPVDPLHARAELYDHGLLYRAFVEKDDERDDSFAYAEAALRTNEELGELHAGVVLSLVLAAETRAAQLRVKLPEIALTQVVNADGSPMSDEKLRMARAAVETSGITVAPLFEA